MKDKQLIVITGPTAVGKTDAVLEFAGRSGLSVISCDSRQFYREMSIGTAKPSREELAKVPHYFINSMSVSEEYSAGQFERDGLKLLRKLFENADQVIMTGGSGLYIKAICEGFDDFPVVSKDVLQTVKEYSLEHLQKELETLDPAYYKMVDTSNKHRLIRALSLTLSSGSPFSSYLDKAKQKRAFNIRYIVLNRERAELYDRINSRVDQMIDHGLVEEVKSLYNYRNHKALQTVGYQEIFSYLEGDLELKTAIELIKRNSRRYAKRQLTWFRKIDGAEWYHPEEFLNRIKNQE